MAATLLCFVINTIQCMFYCSSSCLYSRVWLYLII